MQILSSLSKAAAVAKLAVKEKSPQILIGVGIVSFGAAIGFAIKQTMTLDDIILEHDEDVDKLNEDYILEEIPIDADNDEIAETKERNELREKDFKKAALKLNAKYVAKISWHYAPVLIFTAGGVVCELAGFKIINGRYAAAVAMYETADTMYRRYRDRIRERYGEEADKYALYGTETERYKETEVNPETGKKEKVEKTREIFDPEAAKNSPYYVEIGPGWSIWEACKGDPTYMAAQVQAYQNEWNRQYNEGYPVYFNDILRTLSGNDPRKMRDNGQIAGWFIYDPVNYEQCDGCVDLRFQIHQVVSPDEEDEHFHLYFSIDPNVPGAISLDRAKEFRKKRSGKYISS